MSASTAAIKKAHPKMGLFLRYRKLSSLRLQDVQRVVDDQTEFFHVAFTFVGVSEVPSLTNDGRTGLLPGQSEQRTWLRSWFRCACRLYRTGRVSAACWSVGTVDVPTFNVTGHEAQTWNAVLSHFQIVTDLDRLLARGVEVGDWMELARKIESPPRLFLPIPSSRTGYRH